MLLVSSYDEVNEPSCKNEQQQNYSFFWLFIAEVLLVNRRKMSLPQMNGLSETN